MVISAQSRKEGRILKIAEETAQPDTQREESRKENQQPSDSWTISNDPINA